MKDDISIPHLVNWHTKDSNPLSDLPDVNVRMTFMNTAKKSHSQSQSGVYSRYDGLEGFFGHRGTL